MPLELELMPLEEKILEAPPPESLVVRYGYLKEIGEFANDLPRKVGCGTKLVVRTERGTELAEMLTTTCGNGGCNKSITRDKLVSYIEQSGGRNFPFTDQGRVLRVATVQDLAEQAKLDAHHREHLTLARDLVKKHNLLMKIVDVEHLLGGERVLFYFISEHRIDFRGLVRDLAHELRTRIELRQVGARDEARLTADYEKCGQHCCCKQFLKVLTPISMRAAKVQKATLDPTKISGRCGRLMCCLRYEDEAYEELRKKLPKRNTRVKTEAGDAWVIDGQILTQLVLCQFDDGKREAVPMEKILEMNRPKPIMADGRVMQTANDRPMIPQQLGPDGRPMRGPGGPGGPMGPGGRGGSGGPGGSGGRMERPRPGAPVPARPAEGDPLAPNGPTGGDLNVGGGDELDDLMADALDGQVPPPLAAEENEDPRASSPPSPAVPLAPPQNPQLPPIVGGPPRPQQNFPPRQQGGGGMPRPPQGQGRGGGGGRQQFGPGNQGGRPPQQQRGPQSFRPQQQQQRQGPRPAGMPPVPPAQPLPAPPSQGPVQPTADIVKHPDQDAVKPPEARLEPEAPPAPPAPPAPSDHDPGMSPG